MTKSISMIFTKERQQNTAKTGMPKLKHHCWMDKDTDYLEQRFREIIVKERCTI